MFALVADVFPDPWQIACAEADDAVAGLPLEDLFEPADFLIHVVRRPTFELSNQLADRDGGWDGDAEVNVGFGAADFVNQDTIGVKQTFLQCAMCEWLDFFVEQREAVFGVPRDVEVDFAVAVA